MPKEWITPEGDNLDIQVFLSIGDHSLSPDDNLEQLAQKYPDPIFYSLASNIWITDIYKYQPQYQIDLQIKPVKRPMMAPKPNTKYPLI